MPAHAERTEDSLESRVISAALAILLRQGPRRAKSAHIAAAARTSESTMFRHFRDIDGIFQAAYDHSWEQLNQHIYLRSFEEPAVGGAVEILAAEFDRIWSIMENDVRDQELPDAVTVAFTFYKRPQALSASELHSKQQALFERRIDALCQRVLAERASETAPQALREVVINYAATVWLTWRLGPVNAGLTKAEARLGMLGLLDTFAPIAARGGSGEARVGEPVREHARVEELERENRELRQQLRSAGS